MVHSNKKISNQLETISLKNKADNEKPNSNKSKMNESKEYWNQVASEISVLNGILKRVSGYNNSN